jgi:hypothetical protein
MRPSLGREPGTDKPRIVLIRSCWYPSVESNSTRLSDYPVRAAAASGFGDLPSQFMQETISGRIRFFGARVWIFLPHYLRMFRI